MSHPSFVPPPGFDDLPTEAKVDYLNLLWERVFVREAPESPVWHRDLVRAELEEQKRAPEDSEDWQTARADILDRIKQLRQ